MTRKIKDVLKDAKSSYLEDVNKITTFFTRLIPSNFGEWLIYLSIWIIAGLIILEFLNHPNLNYEKLYLYLLMSLSAKLSLINYNVRKNG